MIESEPKLAILNEKDLLSLRPITFSGRRLDHKETIGNKKVTNQSLRPQGYN